MFFFTILQIIHSLCKCTLCNGLCELYKNLDLSVLIDNLPFLSFLHFLSSEPQKTKLAYKKNSIYFKNTLTNGIFMFATIRIRLRWRSMCRQQTSGKGEQCCHCRRHRRIFGHHRRRSRSGPLVSNEQQKNLSIATKHGHCNDGSQSIL